MTPADRLLARLSRVKGTGPGRWMARCPAHEDRTPSLSIREADDSRVLVNCFAGCATGDVLAAVGLTFADLFPDRDRQRFGQEQLPAWRRARVLAAVEHERLVLEVAAARRAQGVDLSAEDCARVAQAQRRIHHAARLLGAGGRHGDR